MAKERSAFRNRVEASAFRLAVWLFSRLSLPGAERFGQRLGRLWMRVDAKRRRLARTNLARAFPELSEEEVRALSRRVFEHLGGLGAELVWSFHEPLEELVGRFEVSGAEFARAAVASGRGVLFLSPHLGNWEAGAIAFGALGLPATIVVRPLDNPEINRHFAAFRERSGHRLIPKADAAREVLRTLRKGGSIGILPDQHARTPDALVVPFFGRPASTTSAVARFADKTEALILPTSSFRTGPGGRYRITIEEPIDVRTLTKEERTPEALTARVNEVQERQIRKAPEQWMWVHNRWRLD